MTSIAIEEKSVISSGRLISFSRLNRQKNMQEARLCIIDLILIFFYVVMFILIQKLQLSHTILLKSIRGLQPDDLKVGLNLFYVNYDQDNKGNLMIFEVDDQNDYAKVLQSCVLGSI